MRSSIWTIIGLLLPAIAFAARGDGPARGAETSAPAAMPAQQADVERELDELLKTYKVEEQAWQTVRDRSAPSQAKPAGLAPHPASALWPRFEALAQQKCGRAVLWLASHVAQAFPARSADLNRREALQLHKRFVEEHAHEPCVRDWVRKLSGLYIELPEAEIDTLVDRFASGSTDQEAIAEALFRAAAQARRSTREGAAGRAQARTDTLVKDFAETEYGRKARGEEKREVGLAVGKLAPDFTTADAAGKSFRLSDYRGKVVVLDFWGFW